MKKLILIAIAFVSIQSFAQEKSRTDRSQKVERMENFSAEDMATMRTKKLTLALDLTEAQQAETKTLFLKEAEARKEEMKARQEMKAKIEAVKPSKEARQKKKDERMERKHDMKQQMKSILNEAQYAKWETQSEKRGQKMQHRKRNKKH